MLVDLSMVDRVWTVLRVKPGKEAWAEAQASREGMDAYCPRFKRRFKDPIANPLFPGYLFMFLSPALELATIRWIPGMRGPILFRGQIGCVEENLIELWRNKEGGRGYSVPDPRPAIPTGARVRVKEGSFAGFEGVVLESLSARERVRLLLEYLGSTVSVELGIESLA